MVGKDYKATQALARKMSIDRAVQVMQERKISGSFGLLSAHDLESVARRMDSQLWSGWKSSSTGQNGQLLQSRPSRDSGDR